MVADVIFEFSTLSLNIRSIDPDGDRYFKFKKTPSLLDYIHYQSICRQ